MENFFVWNIDPEIFRIGPYIIFGREIGPLAPRWYGLLFAMGFLIGYSMMQSAFRKEGRNEEDLSSLLLYLMVGTILGARLGHCFFYEPLYYLRHPLEILFVWRGGLASHGGTIGVFLMVVLYCRKHTDQPFLWLGARLVTPMALTASLIRLGNFFNSEIIGKPTDLPWAIIFERVDNIPRHPSMLYESICYFLVFLILFYNYRKHGKDVNGNHQIGILLMLPWVARFFIEFTKENQVAFESAMPLNMGQLLSIPIFLVGLAIYTGYYQRWLPQATGEVGSAKQEPGRTTKKIQKKIDRKGKKKR